MAEDSLAQPVTATTRLIAMAHRALVLCRFPLMFMMVPSGSRSRASIRLLQWMTLVIDQRGTARPLGTPAASAGVACQSWCKSGVRRFPRRRMLAARDDGWAIVGHRPGDGAALNGLRAVPMRAEGRPVLTDPTVVSNC